MFQDDPENLDRLFDTLGVDEPIPPEVDEVDDSQNQSVPSYDPEATARENAFLRSQLAAMQSQLQAPRQVQDVPDDPDEPDEPTWGLLDEEKEAEERGDGWETLQRLVGRTVGHEVGKQFKALMDQQKVLQEQHREAESRSKMEQVAGYLQNRMRQSPEDHQAYMQFFDTFATMSSGGDYAVATNILNQTLLPELISAADRGIDPFEHLKATRLSRFYPQQGEDQSARAPAQGMPTPERPATGHPQASRQLPVYNHGFASFTGPGDSTQNRVETNSHSAPTPPARSDQAFVQSWAKENPEYASFASKLFGN